MNTWKYKVNLSGVFHNDELDLVEKAQGISDVIKRNNWYKEMDERYQEDLECFLEELSGAAEEDDVSWFDSVWSAIYDIADADRAWISTR